MCSVWPKMKIMILFTHTHVVPNPYSVIIPLSNTKGAILKNLYADSITVPSMTMFVKLKKKNTIKYNKHSSYDWHLSCYIFQWSINLWTAENRSLSHLVELSQSFFFYLSESYLSSNHENQAGCFLWTSWFWFHKLNWINWTDLVLKLFSSSHWLSDS